MRDARSPFAGRLGFDLDAVSQQRATFPLWRDKRWDLFEGLPSERL